jgi:hypothetical protein
MESSEIQWFSATSITERLSQSSAIGVSGNQRSFRAVFNQRKCFAAFEKAIYSASIVDMDTDLCFYDWQEIVEFQSLSK